MTGARLIAATVEGAMLGRPALGPSERLAGAAAAAEKKIGELPPRLGVAVFCLAARRLNLANDCWSWRRPTGSGA